MNADIKNNILFWQPSTDWFKKVSKVKHGHKFLVFINYIIWFFLFYISFILIRGNTNLFWQLFVATVIGEVIEKVLKVKSFWKRPMYLNNNTIPNGLLKTWYQNGSFPSGHTIKAIFFLIFILQNPGLVNPAFFITVVSPLLLIRIFLGLHYPIDILGGSVFGLIIGLTVGQIQFPNFLIEFIKPIFNLVFNL
ncbi:MAG TPA: phosphatase PAP2 family protein [Candidatus Methanoperedens sp.]|nr:phosphatase PAP2 family protein [Candidatus Methanoperedens sp.]